MISVLEELYCGNIHPADRALANSKKAEDFRELQHTGTQLMEQLEAVLNEQQLMQFHTYCNMQGELTCREQEELFVYAFRLGAKMMIEVLLPRENKLTEGV